VAGGKIDPMHQFLIEPVMKWSVAGYDLSITNSTIWMLMVLAAIWLFMLGGAKGALIPGRWQVAVESVHNFIAGMARANIGPEGRKYVPLIFSLFMFIVVANIMGMMPFGIIPGVHPFTVTSHFTITAVLALLSFSTVIVVGFAKHGLHFFSLFWPKGVPFFMALFVAIVEFFSFMIRPFSLALRLFVAMTAGHILMKVLAGFVINASGAGVGIGLGVGIPTFILMVGISALELLVCGIQAYVFALLTSLYINDAVNLHAH
jgi:F-type H+-transporting ATPase subunit a